MKIRYSKTESSLHKIFVVSIPNFETSKAPEKSRILAAIYNFLKQLKNPNLFYNPEIWRPPKNLKRMQITICQPQSPICFFLRHQN